MSGHLSEGASHAQSCPESHTGPKQRVAAPASLASSRGLSHLFHSIEGAHLLIVVAHDIHARPFAHRFFQFLDGFVIIRDVDGAEEEVGGLDAVILEYGTDLIHGLVRHVLEVGTDVENIDLFL